MKYLPLNKLVEMFNVPKDTLLRLVEEYAAEKQGVYVVRVGRSIRVVYERRVDKENLFRYLRRRLNLG